MTYAEQLRAIRSERHITQKQAYTEVGVPRRTYEDWERGISSPPPYIQKAIIEKLKEPSR